MSLRQRIVLTLVAIAAILAVPAGYGLIALQELQETARTLKTRDAEALLALGRLQQSVTGVADLQRRYSALLIAGTARDTALLRQRVDSASAQVRAALERLSGRGYGALTPDAIAQWQELDALIARERTLIRHDSVGTADTLRAAVIGPAFERMDSLLTPIAGAIDEVGAREVRRAEAVAGTAATTTLLALAGALAVTLVIGAWLTRGLLRPIQELQRGMSTVSEGNFEPDVRIPTDRPDEIGDLARSFMAMAEQLRELDRLKAEFVSVASHEIKTPLSVIKGYVTLIADGIYGSVNEQQRKTLEAVSGQTDRLSRLAHRLLDISRFEAGSGRLDLHPIELRPFFDELTSDFRVLATQNGIEFPVHVAADVPATILGDVDRLNEVLGNLLSNAFKFTPRGGVIRLDAHRDDGGVRVRVEDTGVGIPPDKLPRIFDKFYQVDNDAQPRSAGSGLGLAIAREIVEAHGGTIGAESEVGRGTRFDVFLPEEPPASEAA